MPPTLGGEEHDLRLLLPEELPHRPLLDQIELGVRSRDDVAVAARHQAAHDRRAGEAAMPGDVDLRVGLHRATHSLYW